MKILLIQVGKTQEAYLREGIEKYHKRLKRYINFREITVPDLKNTKNMSEEEIRIREGKLMLRYCAPITHIILLDKKGKALSSTELADFLEKKTHIGKDIVMMIGGAYGFSAEVYERADEMLSFSNLTFSHEMVRLILAEQLYRAMTILRREPYHHD
jgi:23S rRNA (pseudouridine1915-N3)-methyltransferase